MKSFSDTDSDSSTIADLLKGVIAFYRYGLFKPVDTILLIAAVVAPRVPV